MNPRETILSRIREALASPRAGATKSPPAQPIGSQAAAGFKGPTLATALSWRATGADGFKDRLELFQKNAIELRADFHLINSLDELKTRVKRLKASEGWNRVASHGGELTQAACAALDVPLLWTDRGYAAADLEACDAAITECDALIAQTGSVLVTSRTAGGRALSVLPPHHVVIARREQLLPDLTAAFELLKTKFAPDYPGFISLITGPSRTGDIERILVLGAHGPKKLTILCV